MGNNTHTNPIEIWTDHLATSEAEMYRKQKQDQPQQRLRMKQVKELYEKKQEGKEIGTRNVQTHGNGTGMKTKLVCEIMDQESKNAPR